MNSSSRYTQATYLQHLHVIVILCYFPMKTNVLRPPPNLRLSPVASVVRSLPDLPPARTRTSLCGTARVLFYSFHSVLFFPTQRLIISALSIPPFPLSFYFFISYKMVQSIQFLQLVFIHYELTQKNICVRTEKSDSFLTASRYSVTWMLYPRVFNYLAIDDA